MALPSGTRFGSYEITGPLGAGGMGEVYRARDTRLGRDVAIKVLPETVAADGERIARFEREAKTLASLNHPHIAQIYGFETAGPSTGSGQATTAALVMELVEGEDLAERLKRGRLPLDEVLPIARQIAEALEAAHDAGIIHRDLKPANIKVRPDGTVKVLDFGLAKAIDEIGGAGRAGGAGAGAIENSPTITTPAMTAHGMILGTAAYMAPEQAKGKVVDRRADIWAFGCVLYEMLTGSRAFAGEDISDTLVSVLRDDPRWQALPAGTPAHVRTLLRRCLQKDPQKRLPHIGGARLDLTEGHAEPTPDEVPVKPRHSWSAAALWTLTGVALASAGAFMMWPKVVTESPSAVRFAITPRAGESFTGTTQVPRFAVSPDGGAVVYQTQDVTQSRFWVRSLDTLDETAVAGSESSPGGNNRQQPFWSPDGQSIAFFDEGVGQLRRIARHGGTAQTIAALPGNQLAGSWNDDNIILMASQLTKGIQRVNAGGGTVTQVTTVDPSQKEQAHLWPSFLPDGRHFVYLVVYSEDQPSAVFMGSLDGGVAVKLVESAAGAIGVSPDHLLYERGGALVSQRLDLNRMMVVGEPAIVSDTVAFTQAGRLGVSASRNGVLAISTGGRENTDALETAWVDRAGRPVPAAPKSTGANGFRISRDGKRLVYGRRTEFTNGRPAGEPWIQDLERGIETRLATTSMLLGAPPALSHDGQFVAFGRSEAPFGLVMQAVTGAGPERVLRVGNEQQPAVPIDWTPDGKRILYLQFDQLRVSGSLLLLPVEGGDPIPYLTGTFTGGAAMSPDGRFVAITEGGRAEGQVFIRPLADAAAGRWVVSAQGGSSPQWRQDGRELYYLDRSGAIMAVPVTLTPTVSVGAPVPLFQMDVRNAAYPYGASPDGQRFVVLRRRNLSAQPASVVVTVNWLATQNGTKP